MTSIGTDKYRRVSIAPVATFDTTAPVNTDFTQHVPALEGAADEPIRDADSAQETWADGLMSAKYPLAAAGKGSFQTRIYGGTVAATAGAGPSTHFLAKLLASYFNGAAVSSFTGTTVASSSGAGFTAPLKVTSATGLAVGMGLMVGADIAFITAISGTDVTLDHDVAVYTNGTLVYGGFTYSMTLGEYAEHLYFNYERMGHSRMYGPGKVTSFEIQGWTAKEGMRYAFGWDADAYAAGVTPSPTLNTSQVLYPSGPMKAIASPVWFGNTQTKVLAAAFNFGITHKEILATEGTNGRSGWEPEGQAPSGSIDKYYAAGDFTDYDTLAMRTACFTTRVGSNNTAKSKCGMGIFIPQMQIETKEKAENGLVGNGLAWTAHRPSETQQDLGLSAAIYLFLAGGSA